MRTHSEKAVLRKSSQRGFFINRPFAIMLKKYFSAGLLLWVPLAITLWVLESLIRWSDALLNLLPPELNPEKLIGFEIPGLGLVLAALLFLITGVLVANMLGQWIVTRWEWLLEKIPLVRPIYSGVKQILATVLSDRTQSFKEVVLIEFPLAGCWTYGFIVSTPGREALDALSATDMVTVFVPTAPNPTSGYVIMVEREKLRTTSATIEEAFKFHVSLGVMTPAGALREASEKRDASADIPPKKPAE